MRRWHEKKKERNKNRVKSLDFVLNCVSEKIFQIKYYDVVSECHIFQLLSVWRCSYIKVNLSFNKITALGKHNVQTVCKKYYWLIKMINTASVVTTMTMTIAASATQTQWCNYWYWDCKVLASCLIYAKLLRQPFCWNPAPISVLVWVRSFIEADVLKTMYRSTMPLRFIWSTCTGN